jgi:hypothetical protein
MASNCNDRLQPPRRCWGDSAGCSANRLGCGCNFTPCVALARAREKICAFWRIANLALNPPPPRRCRSTVAVGRISAVTHFLHVEIKA